MQRTGIETETAAHYTMGNTRERIFSALGLQGRAPGSIEVETLHPVDQLHHGGIELTERMASAAALRPEMRVLDAGSGLGGSARHIAHRFGCAVDAIDLCEEYVLTARELDGLVGLSGKISHKVGSVTDLPFETDSFDLVWSQNVTMNVPDKHTMFSEALRVLRPGGTLVLTHIGRGDGGKVDYPVPWAMTRETCFAAPPDEILRLLSVSGFRSIVDHATEMPLLPPSPPDPDQPDDSLAMGDDMPTRRANSRRAVLAGALVPMLVTARRG